MGIVMESGHNSFKNFLEWHKKEGAERRVRGGDKRKPHNKELEESDEEWKSVSLLAVPDASVSWHRWGGRGRCCRSLFLRGGAPERRLPRAVGGPPDGLAQAGTASGTIQSDPIP